MGLLPGPSFLLPRRYILRAPLVRMEGIPATEPKQQAAEQAAPAAAAAAAAPAAAPKPARRVSFWRRLCCCGAPPRQRRERKPKQKRERKPKHKRVPSRRHGARHAVASPPSKLNSRNEHTSMLSGRFSCVSLSLSLGRRGDRRRAGSWRA